MKKNVPQADVRQRREDLQRDVEAFLKSGRKIDRIPAGTTAYDRQGKVPTPTKSTVRPAPTKTSTQTK